MTDYEILRHIDYGANFYLDFFGDAEHMESIDNGVYRIISPKDGDQGIKFIYDLRLEDLSDEELKKQNCGNKSVISPRLVAALFRKSPAAASR